MKLEVKKDALELLTNARTLLSNIDNWTQVAGARDIEGCAIHPNSDYAVKWCAIGALLKFYTGEPLDNGYNIAANFLAMEAKKECNMSITSFNDSMTHQDVLDMYDRAIANLEHHGGVYDLPY